MCLPGILSAAYAQMARHSVHPQLERFIRRDDEEVTVTDSRGFGTKVEGRALWSEALPPHTLENVGDKEIHVIAVELKNCCRSG